MGWSTGSNIASPLIEVIKKNVKNVEKRKEIYKVLIEVLEYQDWDTQDESFDIDSIFDETYNDLQK